jgi:hypothetical protein
MNKEDALKAVAYMRSAYPAYFKNLPKEEYAGIINGLLEAFRDDPAADVALGIKTYIGADRSGLPPSNGEIIYHMYRGKDPGGNKAALEAWDMVKRAIRVPPGHREAAFGILPEPARRALGGPYQLPGFLTCAETDPHRFETEIQIRFLQKYAAAVKEMTISAGQQPPEPKERLQDLRERLSNEKSKT